MNTLSPRFGALVLPLTLSLPLLGACASDDAVTEPPVPMDPAGEMAMPEPTAEHAWVLQGAGEWKGLLTSWEAGPDPIEVEATQSVEAIGGFWTLARMECDFMGMPYLGTGHTGYDPERGVFLGTWADNMTPYFATLEGNFLEDGKTLRMRWLAPDWMTGEMVPHWNDTVQTADSHESAFYRGDEDGEHQKVMHISMQRVK